jgi:2-dehydro-3-deoxyphosphogluconate aldolase/(4S)-4-hydroxy-2-oxoglutarate aldolase
MQGLEITFTTPGAAELIAEMRRAAPNALIGAGTVLTSTQAERAAQAGAAFAVAPAAAPEVAAACARLGLPFLPGAATPSEVAARWAEGAAVVKIFPAREAGGPGFLKALKSVFPDIPLLPTGGVSPDTAPDYLAAGALCVGMGGELTPLHALEANDPAPVHAAARRTMELCGLDIP